MKNKKGFTIVELVIVIAVIAILAAVLIPTFSGVIQKSNSSAALQEATSVMKSTLAMSETAILSENTLFVEGSDKGVSYEFKYSGNKIQAIEKPASGFEKIAPIAGGTKSEFGITKYDRIIVGADLITEGSTPTFDAKASTKVQAIIKEVFGAKSIALINKPTDFADNNAKCALTLTLSDDSTVTIGVYVNSDYPADVVTFIPATQNDAPLVQKFDLTITKAEGTTITVTKAGEAVAAGPDVLSNGDELTISVTGGEITVNGSSFNSGDTHTVSGNVTIVSTATT